MDNRILELALEALQMKRNQIDAEIEHLKAEAGIKKTPVQHSSRSKAVSEAMKIYWAKKKARLAGATQATGSRRGPRTDNARKAQSERMKAYWKKRRAEAKKEKA
jgi:hypothetical protein